MRGFAILLIVLGVGTFVLPMMGLQFRLMSLFGSAQPIVAVVAAVVGVVLLIVSLKKSKQ
jgi:hypothetical protein